MKRILIILVVLLVAAGAIVFFTRSRGPTSTATSAATQSGERKVKYYKSTMMLGEISQSPRKDSMGMDMVPVYEDEASDSSTISVDPVTVQNMGIRLGTVTKGPLRRTIRTVGAVDAVGTTAQRWVLHVTDQ